jgi:hypothetical protein
MEQNEGRASFAAALAHLSAAPKLKQDLGSYWKAHQRPPLGQCSPTRRMRREPIWSVGKAAGKAAGEARSALVADKPQAIGTRNAGMMVVEKKGADASDFRIGGV